MTEGGNIGFEVRRADLGLALPYHGPLHPQGSKVLTVTESPRAATTWMSAGLRACTERQVYMLESGKRAEGTIYCFCFMPTPEPRLHMCLDHAELGSLTVLAEFSCKFPIRDTGNS